MQKFELQDAKIFYSPYFIEGSEALNMFRTMQSTFPWESNQIKIFGKTYDVPRKEAYFADPGKTYGYSGKRLTLNPWNEIILKLKAQLELELDHSFNACLANLYRDGSDSNGLHADNEPELGPHPIIASLSFGAKRKFKLKHNATKEVVNFDLTNGSLIVMAGNCQEYWKHEIPKQKKVKEARINLTFRKII
jgi:alkylated DNA repair dioxygenase AlkB